MALPLFNAKNIAWLALESFARQRDIDFEWELVVAEEQDGNHFGKDKVSKYAERLKDVGCAEIKYLPLKTWIPLGQKWKYIADNASSESRGYLCHSADGFAQPYWIREVYDKLIKEEYNHVAYPHIYVYYVPDHKVFQHTHFTKNNDRGCKALSFAFDIKYIRGLPYFTKRKGIDGWLHKSVRAQALNDKGYRFTFVLGDNWKKGFNTHGFHTLSMGRARRFHGKNYPEVALNFALENWPKDIIDRLISIKHKAKR